LGIREFEKPIYVVCYRLSKLSHRIHKPFAGLIFLLGALAGALSTAHAAQPVVTLQPQSQSVVLYQQATFGVTANGTGSLRYQWRKDGVPISAATNNSMVLAHVKFLDEASYSVVISDLQGSVTSSNAFLTVTVPRAGDLDGSFACCSSINGTVQAMARQADGKMIIAGTFTSLNGQARGRVARLDLDGNIDTSFMAGLVGADTNILALAVQSNGKILLGGRFTTVNGVSRNYVARLNPDGTLDNEFLAGRSGPDDRVLSIVEQPDGKIVLGGLFHSVNGFSRNSIARLEPAGSLDLNFGASGTGSDAGVTALAIQPDNKILVGGSFDSMNGVTRNNLARLSADGTLDEAFVCGCSYLYPLRSILVQGQKVLFASFFVPLGGGTSIPEGLYFGRLEASGAVDSGFTNLVRNEVGPEGIASMVLGSDGKLLIGGGWPVTLGIVARLDINGRVETNFQAVVPSRFGLVRTLVAQDEAKVLVGGDFTFTNGLSVSNLVRLWRRSPAFIERVISAGGGSANLSLRLPLGSTNRLQYKTNLSDPMWTELPGEIVVSGLNSKTNVVDTTLGSAPQRFYRLRQEP
jgi:uncharacterized delta-60 repeat protein